MPSTTVTLSSGVSYAPYGVLTVTESATSVANNTSTVTYSLVLKRPYEIVSTATKSASCTINGTTYTWSGTVGGTGDKTLISGTQTVTHNNDGSKSISVSASITLQITWSGQWIDTISNSGSLTLTKLDRYPSCSQSLSSRNETSMTIKWTSDTTISKVEYSTNGGSSYSTATSSANATTGSYTISGLSAGTSYSIRTRVTSKASGLATASSSASLSTYAYPCAQSMPNFNIGDSLTIGVYNPLGRQFRITLIAMDANDAEYTPASSYKGTSVTGWNGTSVINFLYGTIPSATSGRYKVRIDSTIGSSTHSETRNGGTSYYAVKANALPTAGTLAYVDTNTSMIQITNDSSKIVQGKSTVRYTVTGAKGNKSAKISSVVVKVNGVAYNMTASGSNYVGGNQSINSGSNVTATVTVTDSRGYTATTSKTVTMLPYANPTATISLTRESNYYTPTALKVNASCSDLNGGNSVSIQYRYKQSGGSYNSWATINNNTSYTVQLDNQYAWNVQVKVTDTAGGTTTYTKVVQRGMPLMYWDTKRTSIGVGMFPNYDNSLCLDIRRIYMQNDGETGFTMYRSDYGTSANAYLVSETDGATGFAFRFMKPGDSTWTYSSRICYDGVLPYSNNGNMLGSSTMQWGSIYGQTIYENGTALATKYGNHVLKLNSDGGWTDNATVANTTWTTAGSFTVDTGLCLVLAYAQFQTNATGVRMMLIAGATDSTSRYTYMAHDYRNAYTGSNITSLKAMFVTNASSATTLYCRVYQNSGQALQCLTRFTVIRLGNAV